MQARLLVLTIVILPFFATNAVYLLSAFEGNVPWCFPYFDGCTTISQAARSGSSIHLFRFTMIPYAVLLIIFWRQVYYWLTALDDRSESVARTILGLGIIGALALIIYIIFLGTDGEVNRFMRRYGILFFFTLTPLAQLLLLRQCFRLNDSEKSDSAEVKVFIGHSGVLSYQRLVLLLMLVIGVISLVLDVSELKTYQSENIVEWNFSLLLNLYFLGLLSLWRDGRVEGEIR